MVKTIYVSKKMSDEEIAEREGEYFDEKHFDTLDEDADVYTDDGKLLLKLRKKVILKNIRIWLYSHTETQQKKLMKTEGLLLVN